jgi:sulfite reductase (ferredoxin)
MSREFLLSDKSMTAPNEKKPSGQESIKETSVYLKGNIVEELENPDAFVSDEVYELLKFHGSYQGYNRDTATTRKKAGLDKEWEFMLRMKCPGGRLTAAQYLVLDDISDKYANGTLRITTRQTFQFHCIVKNNLKKHIAALNAVLLSTLGGCGDVVRNVICTAAPIKDKIHARLLSDTMELAEFCAPKTSAYHEIWLDGENLASNRDGDNVEPLYGKFYLPRKFKIGLATPDDNSIDVMTHDLAIVLMFKGDELEGYNICMGGGLGATHMKPETYPRLASPIAFVKPDELVRVTEAVIKLQRDHGDRSNRKHARLKYVVEENGLEWTRKTLEEYFGEKMTDPRPMPAFQIPDHMGWHEQKDGKLFLGIPVSSGRIEDREGEKIRTGLREVIRKFGMNITLTADQNIILCDIEESQKSAITEMLKSYGIKLAEDLTNVYKNFLACVALPTCGKALAEAERVKLPLVAEVEKVLEKHGLIEERIAIRIAGCPNGCSRPYVGDIGIVGRIPDHYALFIGGDFEGTRLNTKIFDRVPFANIPEILDIMFAKFKGERNSREGFGDFAHRIGEINIGKLVEASLNGKYKWAKAEG